MSDALLDELKRNANSRGLVLVRSEALCRTLQRSEGALDADLMRLETSGEIDILTPSPFLVLKLRKWPGSQLTLEETPSKREGPEARANSYSFKQSKRLNESYRHPPMDDTLLSEILSTLGESDPTTFRGALRNYSPKTIRATLERVRKARHVRTTRVALFRYLLPRIAKHPASIH